MIVRSLLIVHDNIDLFQQTLTLYIHIIRFILLYNTSVLFCDISEYIRIYHYVKKVRINNSIYNGVIKYVFKYDVKML